MLNVDPSVIDAFNASTIAVTGKANIFFIDNVATTYTHNDYIISIDTVEEECSDSSNIFGALSANELVVRLLNTNNHFSLTNINSPLYGKMLPNLVVEVYISIDVDSTPVDATPLDSTPVEVPLGTFYSAEWRVSADGTYTDLVCYDRLFKIASTVVNPSIVYTNLTIKELLETLFSTLSIANVYIDSTLSTVVPYYWFSAGTLRDTLQKFVDGYGCKIYIDRSNTLVITRSRSTTVVDTLTDSNQIVSTSIPQDTSALFSSVAITYSTGSISSELELNNSTIDTTASITFTQTGVTSINHIQTEAAVSSLTYTNATMDITVEAPTPISITGHIVQLEERIETVIDPILVTVIGTRTLNITSDLVQTAAAAQELAEHALSLVNTLGTKITIVCNGNAALELGDCVRIIDTTKELDGLYNIVHMQHSYDGALNATYTLVKGVV